MQKITSILLKNYGVHSTTIIHGDILHTIALYFFALAQTFTLVIGIDWRITLFHFLVHLIVLFYLNNSIAFSATKMYSCNAYLAGFGLHQINLSEIKKITIRNRTPWRYLLYCFFIFDDQYLEIHTKNKIIKIPCIGLEDDYWERESIDGTIDHILLLATRNNIPTEDLRTY